MEQTWHQFGTGTLSFALFTTPHYLPGLAFQTINLVLTRPFPASDKQADVSGAQIHPRRQAPVQDHQGRELLAELVHSQFMFKVPKHRSSRAGWTCHELGGIGLSSPRLPAIPLSHQGRLVEGGMVQPLWRLRSRCQNACG